MQVKNILINHMQHPLGFDLSNLRIEFQVENDSFIKITKQLIITDDKQNSLVYQTPKLNYDNNYFDVDLQLKPRTRYTVIIKVESNELQATGKSYFETGKMNEKFVAKWIANKDQNIQNTIFRTEFKPRAKLKCARLYASGLGLYEAYLNGTKIGNEFLSPGCTAYDQWVQIQTYDLTDLISSQNQTLTFSTGDGWYKGTMGFDGGKQNIYGERQMIIAELHLDYQDGTSEIIKTDKSWETTHGKITRSSIYYGEDLDDTITLKNWESVMEASYPGHLTDRLSLPVKIETTLNVKKIIETPAHEQVLDFGQNQAGWLEFYNREPKGTKITFQMGEILQKGNFYRGNLRKARAAFTYISDGQEKWIRPHFTYFGYRYVKVTGNTRPLNSKDFHAAVLYSHMPLTGKIETSNAKVNRLFQNIQWGQKSNFIDIPTDCPQRDERLGWTGDAEIFSNTAAFNMNVFEFYKKYARDMQNEQQTHHGMLTMYAPSMGTNDGGAAAWSDAATIIPWNMYQIYGDPAIIKQNYNSMKAWVDWITSHTTTSFLWTGGFQFGDWLALDNETPGVLSGKTNSDYIASLYYLYSTQIVAQAANLLNYNYDAQFYTKLANKIKNAIQNEFVTPNGRLAIDTQTAYALALHFNLMPSDKVSRTVKALVKRLNTDNDHLKTGFIGTPYVCQVLSANGQHKLAMKIFMQEDYPSWLYAINMGATTVWERWNSVLPDGTMNPDGMNSLNHYSIGAIMEWAYKYVLGIQISPSKYQNITFEPHFDYRLKKVSGQFATSYGVFKASYQIEKDQKHTIGVNLTIPFGMNVQVKLPRSLNVIIKINNRPYDDGNFNLTAGKYNIEYVPTVDYIERYNADTPSSEIMADPELVNKIAQIDNVLYFFKNNPDAIKGGIGKMSLKKMNTIFPFINISDDHLQKINRLLSQTPILSERQ